jgi:hypothetical protein
MAGAAVDDPSRPFAASRRCNAARAACSYFGQALATRKPTEGFDTLDLKQARALLDEPTS